MAAVIQKLGFLHTLQVYGDQRRTANRRFKLLIVSGDNSMLVAVRPGRNDFPRVQSSP
jgi:hypothetical protein